MARAACSGAAPHALKRGGPRGGGGGGGGHTGCKRISWAELGWPGWRQGQGTRQTQARLQATELQSQAKRGQTYSHILQLPYHSSLGGGLSRSSQTGGGSTQPSCNFGKCGLASGLR